MFRLNHDVSKHGDCVLVISQLHNCVTNWRKDLRPFLYPCHTSHDICRSNFIPSTEAYGVQQEVALNQTVEKAGKGFLVPDQSLDETFFSGGLLEGGDAGAHSGLAYPCQGCITSQLLF